MMNPDEYITKAEDAAAEGETSYARQLLGEAVHSFGEETVFELVGEDTPQLMQLFVKS